MRLEETEHVYSQEPDCCSSDIGHTFAVRTEDGGGGPFLVIKTERWAFEDEADICRFAKRLCKLLRRAEKTHQKDEKREQAKSVNPD